MFFVASKVFWFFLEPANLLLILLAVGTVLLWTRKLRAGRRVVALATLALIVVQILPVGAWLLLPLENRFPPVPDSALPPRVDGIIVLGGAVDQFRTVSRGQPSLNDSAERMTAFVTLARRYPEAKLVFTGGSGYLVQQEVKEALVARLLFEDLGLDPARIVYEDESRNTYENAVFSRRLVQPERDEVWLLVTSAMHMPRAVGIFRRAGWPVRPYPVDYATVGNWTEEKPFSFVRHLDDLNAGVHEWLGLVAYRISGRTDALFPGPEAPKS